MELEKSSSNSVPKKALKQLAALASSMLHSSSGSYVELQVSNILKRTKANRSARVIVTPKVSIEIRCNGQQYFFRSNPVK